MKTDKSNLGFGGASLTSMKSYNEVKGLLNVAYEAGIRHFDTAVLYGKGYSELILGQFLKDKRQNVTITTKFGLGQSLETGGMPIQILMPLNYHLKKVKNAFKKPVLSATENPYIPVSYREIDKKLISKSFYQSLDRLKTDYVDYYLLHEGLPSFLTDEALNFLLDLKRRGRVRFIGIGSNILDIKTLNIEEVKNWDVLQYEGNIVEETQYMMQKFPNKIHFHHSCLKNRDNISLDNINPNDRVGYILAQNALQNPEGKIIFSTRNKTYLENNIQSFSKYYH
jgi:aryl-alcohol dehydrogenase-like predicted oxidoreductase